MDWIFIVYSLLVAAAILLRSLAGGPFPRAFTLTALHLGVTGGTILLARSTRRLGLGASVVIRFIYGVALIPVLYLSLGGIVEEIHPFRGEILLKRIDDALFPGQNPNVFLDRLQNPFITEYLQIIYSTYYFMPLVLFLGLVRRRLYQQIGIFQAAVLLCLLLSYIGYFLVPATSPGLNIHGLYPWPSYEEEIRSGTSSQPGILFAEGIRRSLYEAETIQHDCFPSAHTAMSLVVLCMAWRFHRKVFGILLVPVLSLVFSTMYLRYHYVIDVIAGVGLAGISMDLSGRLERAYCGFLDRRAKRLRERKEVP